jgi:hypothetical protein
MICKNSASNQAVAAPARSPPDRFDCPKSVMRGRGARHEYLPAANDPRNLPAAITTFECLSSWWPVSQMRSSQMGEQIEHPDPDRQLE